MDAIIIYNRVPFEYYCFDYDKNTGMYGKWFVINSDDNTLNHTEIIGLSGSARASVVKHIMLVP